MKFTHPKFKEFIKCIEACNVDYLLVGGYAVILHGYIRGTGDMDVWLNPTEENRARLKEALLKYGYSLVDLKVLDDSAPIDALRGQIVVGEFHIDLITMVSRLTFEQAKKSTRLFKIEEIEVRVIDLEDLILTKMNTGRPEDLNDINHLKNIAKK